MSSKETNRFNIVNIVRLWYDWILAILLCSNFIDILYFCVLLLIAICPIAMMLGCCLDFDDFTTLSAECWWISSKAFLWQKGVVIRIVKPKMSSKVCIYIYRCYPSNNHNPINTHHSPINIRSKSNQNPIKIQQFFSVWISFFTVPGVAGTGSSPSSPPSPPPPRRRRVLRVVGVVLAEGCHGCHLHRALMTWKHGKTRSKHKEVHGIHRSVLSKMIDLMGKLIMINNHWWEKRQEPPHPNQIIDHVDNGDSILSS